MNILILTTHLNPGGISRYVINLATGLKRQGNSVWVASSSGSWLNKLKNLGVSHKTIPIKTKSICSIKIFLSFLRLYSFIREHKIDVVHCNTRVTQALGFFIYKLLKTPYISAYHGFYRPSFFRRLFKFSGLRSIAVSSAVKGALIKDLNVEDTKTRVVYNGIDRREFLEGSGEKSCWGFKEEDYLVGILGRVSREKGFFLAVEALLKLSSKYKNMYLVISGEGKMKEKLKIFIKEANLEQRVKFVNCEANDFLNVIDLLIVPSEKEGFGYSIVEAFLKGVPVVGFNVGGIAEIIKDRKNGVLFYDYNSSSLAQAIESFILDKNLKEKVTAKAKEDVSFFTAERMAEDTLKVYKEILM